MTRRVIFQLTSMTHCVISSKGLPTRYRLWDMARAIKRYGNRKLYDTDKKQYVSLQEIAALIREGHEVVVTDNGSGRDITPQTLAKIIMDEKHGGQPLLPREVLHDFVRWGGKVMSSGMEHVQTHIDRLILAAIQRVAPVEQLRADLARLNRQVESLEVLVAERRGKTTAADSSGGTPMERSAEKRLDSAQSPSALSNNKCNSR